MAEISLPTPQELVELVGDFTRKRIEGKSFPGAAFVMVKDGDIYCAQKFGHANLESNNIVSAEETIFHIASVSKTLTATAVMQLNDRGKFRFDDPIGKYVQLKTLKPPYGEITIANILHHNAGFDERLIGVSTEHIDQWRTLGEYLNSRMPPQVLPPGIFRFYSNHGYALLGHLVETLSGLPFDQYITESILNPLGMDSSTFSHISELTDNHAVGYTRKNNQYIPHGVDYAYIVPAGSFKTTVTDMARFMIAHLNGGVYDGRRILEEATVQKMHTSVFRLHPQMPGQAYGFAESFYRGQRMLTHNGMMRGFGSVLYLIPEHNLGFFLVANRYSGSVTSGFPRWLLDRLIPKPEHIRTQIDQNPGNYQAQKASFRHHRYSRSTIEKFMSLQNEIDVPYMDDGTSDEGVALLQKIGNKRTAFKKNAKGRVTHMFRAGVGTTEVYEVIPWYEKRKFLIGMGGGLIGTIIIGLLLSFLPGLDLPNYFLPALWATTTLNLFFLVGLGLAAKDIITDYWDLAYGLPVRLRMLLILPILTAFLTLLMLGFTLSGWIDGSGTPLVMIYYTLMSLANAGLTWMFHHWNLLGFRY